MLSTLKKLLETDPTKLGKGRDHRGWDPYDRLHLVRAWRLDDDGEALTAREKVKGEMEMLVSNLLGCLFRPQPLALVRALDH